MPDRTVKPKERKIAVFVREIRGNKEVFIRRPYNIVELNWGDAQSKTYLHPTGGRPISASETEEAYDEVRILNENPPYDLQNPRR